MRAVVHIGTGKAGSTTIQDNTFAQRTALLQNGVLIPAQNGRRINQKVLFEVITGKAPRTATDEILSSIEDEIATYSPSFLFLSSEHLFEDLSAITALENFIAPWAADLQVVLYLRDPVRYYVSLCQQVVKAGHAIDDPAVWRGRYRSFVEPWRQHYGDRLTVIPFQKSAFPEGLVNNLIGQFFPEIASSIPDLDYQQHNQADPIEVSCLMQTYFRTCYPDEPREFRAFDSQIHRHLLRTAMETGIRGTPKLRPQVAATIMSNNSRDVAWLAAEEGYCI